MDVGRMNRRVELQTVMRTEDDDGGFVEVWAAVPGGPDGKLAAAFLDPTAANVERVMGGAVQALIPLVVRMHYHASATTQARLVDGTQILHIVGTRDIGDRHEWMDLTVEARKP